MHIYDALLWLYPTSFRNEYGTEMRAVFKQRRREAAGFLAIVALWASTLGEVLSNAAYYAMALGGGKGTTVRARLGRPVGPPDPNAPAIDKDLP